MNLFKKLIWHSPAIEANTRAILDGKYQERYELQKQIEVVTGYSDARIVHTIDGDLSKSDWLAHANERLEELNNIIAELVANG